MDPNNNPATAWTAALGQLQQDITRQWQQAVRPPAPVNPMFGAWAPFATPNMMGNPMANPMAGLMGNPMANPMVNPMANPMAAMSGMMGGMMPGMSAPIPSASPMAAWDQYFRFSQSIAEQFKKMPGVGNDPAAQGKEFANAMDGWFRKLGSSNPLLAAFNQMLPGMLPGASAGNAAPQTGAPQAAAGPAPALGLMREHQEAWQRLTQSATKLQQLQAEFTALWTRVGNDAADKFGSSMSARLSGNHNFNSVMEIYNLWVECAEECYAKVAHSDEYAKLVAALTNTTHELRLEQQRQAEGWARQLDLPTRSELNELLRQIRELRAELAEQGGPSSPRRGF